MASTGDRVATYLGIRPADPPLFVAPRTWLARIGTPGPDTSVVEHMVGIAFLLVLIVAWITIVLVDTTIAVRVLAAAAVVLDAVMIVARVKLLFDRSSR